MNTPKRPGLAKFDRVVHDLVLAFSMGLTSPLPKGFHGVAAWPIERVRDRVGRCSACQALPDSLGRVFA